MLVWWLALFVVKGKKINILIEETFSTKMIEKVN